MKIGKKTEERIKAGIAKFKKVLVVAKNRDLNESDTVAIINDMLAEVFGYEKYSEITSELMIRGTFCDLAIRLNDKFENGFLIECKRVGIELKEEHMRQAVNYGVNKGIQWVVLTNGLEWRLYRLKFDQPVTWDMIARFNWETIDPKCEQDIEKVFCLCKEGVEKGAREELFEKVQCVNRFVIGQLLLQDPVISVVRKELRKMADDISVEEDEIQKILLTGVLRRDIIDEEEPETQKATQRVAKFYKQSVKKVVKKPVEKANEAAPAPQQNLSVTEQLLKEAEAGEKPSEPTVSASAAGDASTPV